MTFSSASNSINPHKLVNKLKTLKALSAWCQEYDLNLNTKKTKEMIIDFRKNKNTLHTKLCIDEYKVDKVSSFKLLGVRVSANLTWSLKSSHQIKKAQKRPFHPRMLKRNRLPQKLHMNFYHCTIESVLTYSMGTQPSTLAVLQQRRNIPSGW